MEKAEETEERAEDAAMAAEEEVEKVVVEKGVWEEEKVVREEMDLQHSTEVGNRHICQRH